MTFNGVCVLQINKNDYTNYDYIFGMDNSNILDLKERAPKNATAKILLLGDFDPKGDKIIRDPYYVSVLSIYNLRMLFYEFMWNEWIIMPPIFIIQQDDDMEGFEKCYVQSVRCCEAFLQQVNDGKI